jgi:mitochondrial fission protein ELM1
MQMLASATHIVVAAMSESMVSDACLTGKPIYLLDWDSAELYIERYNKQIGDTATNSRLKIFDENVLNAPLEMKNFKPFDVTDWNVARLVGEYNAYRKQEPLNAVSAAIKT